MLHEKEFLHKFAKELKELANVCENESGQNLIKHVLKTFIFKETFSLMLLVENMKKPFLKLMESFILPSKNGKDTETQ
jgi:hypothetical protein